MPHHFQAESRPHADSRRIQLAAGLFLCLGLIILDPVRAFAADIFPQRRQNPQASQQQVGQKVAEAGQSVRKATGLIRLKKFDEAEKLLDEAEQQLGDLVSGGIPQNNPIIATLNRNIAVGRRALEMQRKRAGNMPGKEGAKGGVSFSEDVAPIVETNCLGCHSGDDPKGELNLDTFTGWEAGGASKMPLARVLLARLTAPQAKRMPKGKPALPQQEIRTIALWIRQGGRYDGESKETPIRELGGEDEEENQEPVMINKPTGDETVSFTKQVAPFMVKICGECHTGNEPEGELDMTTFEGLMRGGVSGQVITPGDPEGSRLWLLASNREQPRMPPGQRRITRANYDALTTWIREGAVFDGDDAKKPMSQLVPSDDEAISAKLASMSSAEFAKHRREQSDAHWNRAFPKEESQPLVTDQFLVYGNVPKPRAEQIVDSANGHLDVLGQSFGAAGNPLWKGKLAIYLLKDRFSYQEFALSVNDRRRVPENVHGHAVVSANLNEAYIVLEDVGETPSVSSPGTRATLANLLTQAYVSQLGGDLPDWVVQGSGLHMAARANPENPYFTALRKQLGPALGRVKKPEQLFDDGTFSPEQAPAVNVALVDFLIRANGTAKYTQFLKELGKSGDLAAATRAAFGTTPAAVSAAFAQSLGR